MFGRLGLLWLSCFFFSNLLANLVMKESVRALWFFISTVTVFVFGFQGLMVATVWFIKGVCITYWCLQAPPACSLFRLCFMNKTSTCLEKKLFLV